jgi:hypothetical protein
MMDASHIIRLLPPATIYYLVQCCYKISLLLISITRLLPSATRLTRFTTHAWGLLYFTNYHTHDYENFKLYNKTLDESKQHTRGVFIDQRVVPYTGSTNRTSLTKVSVKRQKSIRRGHAREGTVLKNKQIRKNIPTLYTL